MCCYDPPHKKYWRLYYLLDLIPPVTSKQVKWNFRKVTLRHHYYQAYLVLYNHNHKYFYDALGEEAYGFVVSGTWGPMVPFLGIVGTTLTYTLIMLIQIALLIIFFAFLGARVDDVITWDWSRVVAPLMAFVCIAWIICTIALIVSFVSKRTWREGMAAIDRVSPCGNWAAACCYLALPFVIGNKLRDDTHAIDGHLLKYMTMPIVGDILYYLTSLIWRWPKRLRLQMEVETDQTNGVVTWGIFIMAFLNMGCGVAQWILIGKKIDGTLNRSWYIIFIPCAVRAGVRIAEACLRSLMKYYQGVRSEIGVAFDTVGSFFVNGILLISLYFVAVRIHRGKEKCRMARALIPVYVTLAYMFIAMIVTMIYLLVRSCQKSKTENAINNAWVPRDDDDAVLGAKGTAGGNQQPGTTTSSGSGPIPGQVNKNQDWDDFDGESASSAAFPSNVRSPYEPVDGDGDDLEDHDEYDDFDSADEEDDFPVDEEDEEERPDEHDDEYTYTEGDTPANHEEGDYAFPVQARADDTVASSRPSSRRPRAAAAAAPAPLTAQTDDYGDSEYTYEYDDEEEDPETFSQQSAPAHHGDDDDEYYYYEYSDQSAMSGSDGSSAFSSSFASSVDRN